MQKNTTFLLLYQMQQQKFSVYSEHTKIENSESLLMKLVRNIRFRLVEQ